MTERERQQRRRHEKERIKRRKADDADFRRRFNLKKLLKKEYGLTVEAFDALVRSQRGVCAICHRANPSGRRLSVDHDHVTGAIRGALCDSCNRGLGFFADNPERLERAAQYVRER